MTRARRVRGGGPIFAGVVAVALTLPGCSGGTSDGPSSDPSPTASARPAISAASAPTPSPAPSGFLPVDSLGASEIPWDEVGPGWFLVEWVEHDAVGRDYAMFSAGAASESLLSPSGQWYAARSLQGTGAEMAAIWLGEDLAVFRMTQGNQDDYAYPNGETSLVSLRDGAMRQVNAGGALPFLDGVAADGSLLGVVHEYEGDGAEVVRFGDGLEPNTLCQDNSATGGHGLLSLAPDGVRVVCLAWTRAGGDGPQTAVMLARVGEVLDAERVDAFGADPPDYRLMGWISQDTFLLARRDVDVAGWHETYFSYDVATRQIADFTLPFAASGVVYFDWATKTYSDRQWNPDYVPGGWEFYGADGALVASVPCSGRSDYDSPTYSGSRALIWCRTAAASKGESDVTLTLVDLATGTTTVVASVHEGSGQRANRVFGYPTNL